LVLRSVRAHLNPSADIEDAALINTHVARVEVQSDRLVIELTNAKGIGSKRTEAALRAVEQRMKEAAR
jgi:hypothetical protein